MPEKLLSTRLRRLGCRWVSYSVAVALVKLSLRTPMIERRALSMARELYETLERAGIPFEPRETAHRFFMLKKLFPWAYCRFLNCSRKELDHWVHMDGLEHLDSRGKQGVLLVACHFGPGHLAKYALGARGYTIYNVRANNNFLRKYPVADDNDRMSEEIYVKHDKSNGLLRTIATVRDLLRRGEIVACALDGKHGSSDGIRLTLLGHHRRFRTALPLVAALTGARIIPVFCALSSEGKIDIRIDAPFPDRSPSHSPLDYATEVVRSYVEKVQAFCEANPGQVKLKPLD